MNRRARLNEELETALRTRMELTRAQLLAANVASRIGTTGKARAQKSPNALTIANVGRALSSAPNVTLIGSIVLGSLLMGPKRIVPVVVRTGVTGWIARNVRSFVAR